MDKKTILVATDQWFGSTGYAVVQGFGRLGWDVQIINPSNYFKRYDVTIKKLAGVCIRPISKLNYNKAVIKAVNIYKPKIFFTVKGIYLNTSVLEKIKRKGIKLINYYPDCHFSHKSFDSTTLPYYDAIFTTKSFQVNYLQSILDENRVHYLPHGYSNDAHIPPKMRIHENKLHELIYIGSFSMEKMYWLEKIRNNFPSIGLAVYGDNWYRNIKRSNIKNCVMGEAIYGQNYCNKIYNSKINLAVHMGVLDGTGWKDLVSTRTFEIPACKGFMLHIDNSEVREFFDPETEIGVFADEAELFEKIEYYLSNDKIRAEMIENAYYRCVPAYSYDERCKVMSNYLIQ